MLIINIPQPPSRKGSPGDELDWWVKTTVDAHPLDYRNLFPAQATLQGISNGLEGYLMGA